MKSESGTVAPSDRETKAFGIGVRIFVGSMLAVLLIAGAGGWAATATLTGAVIAQGSVRVDEELKAIQHRDGGIVREILVRQGDSVEEGQVLIRLEDAQTKAELSIIRSQIAELSIRQARLLAERDGLAAMEFPRGSTARIRRSPASSWGRRASSKATGGTGRARSSSSSSAFARLGTRFAGSRPSAHRRATRSNWSSPNSRR